MKTKILFKGALLLLSVFSVMSCTNKNKKEKEAKAVQNQPNIVWITCEDISPYIACFGDELVKTPNIDALAADGVRFNYAYTTAGVCSPSRSSIITAMYPTSIGTQHMRTKSINPIYSGEGVPNYDAKIPEYVRCFPEYLRKAGYYTTNNAKTDYQFDAPATVWDESSPAATYENRPDGKPFFAIFNLAVTHESQLMSYDLYPEKLSKGGFKVPERPEPLGVDVSKIEVPPYYMDTEATRHDIARNYTNIQVMDSQVGKIVQELKDKGLYDQTIIFFYSDHGGALPWMKRELTERGTHIPLVVKLPGQKDAGTENNNLVSAVDFGPSVLSLAGVPIPDYYQGQPFLGSEAVAPRKYTFGGRDRMDAEYDRVRYARDKQFLYLYNYMPELPYYQPLDFRYGIAMMREILTFKDQGKITNPYLKAWFEPKNVTEELYDTKNDPHQLHNLADDPKYKDKLIELRTQFKQWTAEVGDMSDTPEKDMVYGWWDNQKEEPFTATPKVEMTDQGAVISCATEGASIGYRIVPAGQTDEKLKRTVKSYDFEVLFGQAKNGDIIEVEKPYDVYDGAPIKLNRGDQLIVNARRIGNKDSEATFTY